MGGDPRFYRHGGTILPFDGSRCTV